MNEQARRTDGRRRFVVLAKRRRDFRLQRAAELQHSYPARNDEALYAKKLRATRTSLGGRARTGTPNIEGRPESKDARWPRSDHA